MTQPRATIYKHVPHLAELQSAFPGLKSLFFDMDGTLFDTERFHTRAFLKIGQDYKVEPPLPLERIHSMLVGKADHLVFEVVRHWQGFPKHWDAQDFVSTKTNNLLNLLREVPAEEYFPKELHELLKLAQAEGIFLALVTSSERVITDKLLKVAKIYDFFNLIVTRDDCPRHKPDPWPYIEALRVSGHSPAHTVIFEDSEVGLEAALASGSHVVKVEWHEEFKISRV